MSSLKVSFCFQSRLHLCYQHWTHLSKWGSLRCLIGRTFQESNGPTAALCDCPWWDNSDKDTQTMINASSPEPFSPLKFPGVSGLGFFLHSGERGDKIGRNYFTSEWEAFPFWLPEMKPPWVAAAPHTLNCLPARQLSEPEAGCSPLQAFQFITANYIRRRI